MTKIRRARWAAWLGVALALSLGAGIGAAVLWGSLSPAPPPPASSSQTLDDPGTHGSAGQSNTGHDREAESIVDAAEPRLRQSASAMSSPAVSALQRTLQIMDSAARPSSAAAVPGRGGIRSTPAAPRSTKPVRTDLVRPAQVASPPRGLTLAGPLPESPQTARALSRASALTRLDIPLLLDQLPLGDVAAYLSQQEELIAFDGAMLLKLIDRYILPGKLAALRARIGAGGRLTVADIEAEGLSVTYDLAGVSASIGIPHDMRTTQSLSLSNPYGADGRAILRPADVSGYVNLLAGRSFVPDREGPEAVVLDLDGAVNLFGNVLEGVATYRDAGTVRWARGDTRIVRDDPESRTRISAGDINYGIDGFQSRQSMAGFAIARNFGLQPYRSSAPVGQTDLDLDRNSRVDIIVNGQRMRTIDLAPGRYNVRDLPLVGGTNDVTLRVTDEVGRVDVIRFPFVFDASVLAKGEQDFGYAVGVASQPTETGREYKSDDRVISAFHTLGLTDQLTIGGNYQGSKSVRAIGGEGRLATAYGTFRLDGAVSDASFAGTGHAVRLQHRFSESVSVGGMNRSISSSASYRSRAFASIGQTSANNPVALSVAMLYSQRLYGNIYGSLGVGRQFARDGQPSISTVDANLSVQLAKDVTASLLMSTRQASFGGSDSRAFLSISWFPAGSTQRVGTSYDTTSQARRGDWAYTPPTRVDAIEADLSVERNHERESFDGRVGYTGYRFDAGLSNATTVARSDGGGGGPRTNVNFGTAVAYAGGHLALTRPITDSFALFVPHPTLKGKTIEINRAGDTPDARTDLMGTAVLPELISYYQHHVMIDAPDLPLGFDLGRTVYDVVPTYRSGALITVGTGAVVLGDGILLDETGKELPLELGTIVSLEDPSLPPIEFFTSRTGRFRVEGLAPGRFRLTLANEPEKAIEFLVPPGSVGRVDLGRLTYPIKL